MSLFRKGNAAAPRTERKILEDRYKNSIANILFIIGFTTLNAVLLLLPDVLLPEIRDVSTLQAHIFCSRHFCRTLRLITECISAECILRSIM